MAGRERRPYGHPRPSRVAQDPAAGSLAEARYRRRRTPNRGPWLLLALGLLSCLLVAEGLLWYRDSPVENARLAPVDRRLRRRPSRPCPRRAGARSRDWTESSRPSPRRTRAPSVW